MPSFFHPFYRGVCYFFRGTPDPVTFQKGSPLHLFFLALAMILAAALISHKEALRERTAKKKLRRLLGLFLLLQQTSLYGWYLGAGIFQWYVSLPLYNCRFAAICMIFAFLGPWRFPRWISCYWGLWGATAALLLPDLDRYLFPHFTAITFFGGHILLLLGALSLITVEGFLPSADSLRGILLFTNLYHGAVYGVNVLTGGNYCYLMNPPFSWALFEWLQRSHLYLIFVLVLFNLVMLLMHWVLRWAHQKAFPEPASCAS